MEMKVIVDQIALGGWLNSWMNAQVNWFTEWTELESNLKITSKEEFLNEHDPNESIPAMLAWGRPDQDSRSHYVTLRSVRTDPKAEYTV